MDPFTLEIGLKSAHEQDVDGETGLVIQGYASRYHEVDRAGERQLPGAFAHIDEEWGAEREPILLWQHGLDPDLGTRRLGRGLRHRLDDEGLYIEAFIPKQPRFKDASAVRRFKAIYDGITSGAIKGLSVGGSYLRTATGAIKRWSLAEVSVTDRPCLPSATFTVGAKAIGEAYGTLPPILDDDDDDAHDARGAEQPRTGGSVNAPQRPSTIAPTLMPLAMPAGNVTVSAPVGAAEGAAWTLSYAAGGNVLSAGSKALTKGEPDGAHPSSHYLFVGDPQVVGTWKLRYKDADGNVSPRLLGACHAALTVGYRGQKVDLPEDEKQRCLQRLKGLYKQAGLDWPADQQSGGKALGAQDGLRLVQHDARRADRHAARTVFAALDVLDDFATGVKQGRQHSAATVAAVQKIADGLDAHVRMLRAHFGIEGPAQDDEQDQEDDEQDQQDDGSLVG